MRNNLFVWMLVICLGAGVVCWGTDANNPCKEQTSDDDCQEWVPALCDFAPTGGECCDECTGGSCIAGNGSGGGSGGQTGRGGTGGQTPGPYATKSAAGGGYGPSGIGSSKGRATFRASLGMAATGKRAGTIRLKLDGPGDAQNPTPKSLVVLTSKDSEVVKDVGVDGLERVYASETEVQIVTLSATAYEMRFYHPGETNDPFTVWRVADPDGGTNGYKRLVTSQLEGSATNDEFRFEWAATNVLVMVSGQGLREERVEWHSQTGAGGEPERVDIHEISTPGGSVVSRSVKIYRTYLWGPELVEERRGPEGSEEVFYEAAYNDDDAETGSFGNRAWEKNNDGSWKRYNYDAAGRLVLEVTPLGNAPFETTNLSSLVQIKYDYTCLDPLETPRLGDNRWRTKERLAGGVSVEKSYRAFYTETATGDSITIEEETITSDAEYGDSSNRRTLTRKYGSTAPAALKDRVLEVEYSDGRTDEYTYEQGSYQASTNGLGAFTVPAGGAYVRITETPDAENIASGQSIRTVRIEDGLRREVQSETQVWTGSGFETMDWTCNTLDEYGRETEVRYANGLIREITWDCCGKASELFPDGRQEYYVNDGLKRMVTKTVEGISAGVWPAQADRVTTYEYDASGNLLKETISAGGLSLVTSNAWDLAGRKTSERAPDGLLTEISYNGQTTTVTVPGGATTITEKLRDGKVASVTGTGVVPRYYEYGVETNGHEWTRTNTGTTPSPVWTLKVTDRIGQTDRRERPGYGGTVLTNCYYYDDNGRLVRQTETGKPDNLYEYDERGNLFRSGADVNGNGTLDPASMDQISDRYREYVTSGGHWYNQQTSLLYPHDGNGQALTTSVSRVLVGGSGCSCSAGESETIDIFGNTATVQTSVDAGSKEVTRTVARPGISSEEVTVTINGLVQSQTREGIEVRYLYDALGRQTGVIDPRTGTNTTSYVSNGRIEWTEDAAGNRTTYAYDAVTGRRTEVSDALSNTVYTAYDLQGRTTNTWGASYPVAYEYDIYGRMAAMKTWRDESGAPDVTQWQYDEATGLLTNKVYADEKGTGYVYTPEGKLASRLWERGVVTDYAYDLMGQLTNINYSDDTPDVSVTYNRNGQQVTVEDAQGTRTFTYNQYLQLTNETIVANGVTSMLARTYDAYGRPDGMSLGEDYSVGYGYNVNGRMAGISSEVRGLTNEWAYGYLADSSLIETLAEPVIGITNSRSYEEYRNLITQVRNQVEETTVSQYDYINDAVGRRTERVDAISPSVLTNIFGYNPRSELTSALMDTNVYGYAYDPIGNRLTATNNGESLVYQSNPLNQYTNIADGVQYKPTYDADGNLLTWGPWTYEWDAENRLVVVSTGSTAVVTNVYDYMSRRVEKVSGGESRVFTYDGWNMIREQSDIRTNHYVWGLDLSGTLQGAGGIGGLLCASLDGEGYYPSCDANGNITEYADENGTVAARYEYDPYGSTMSQSGALADAFVYRFSSKYWDSECGLYYYGYRYYIPTMGRWASPDPVNNEGFCVWPGSSSRGIALCERLSSREGYRSMSRKPTYTFVRNSPIRSIDRLGLTQFLSKCEYNGRTYYGFAEVDVAISPPLSVPWTRICYSDTGGDSVLAMGQNVCSSVKFRCVDPDDDYMGYWENMGCSGCEWSGPTCPCGHTLDGRDPPQPQECKDIYI